MGRPDLRSEVEKLRASENAGEHDDLSQRRATRSALLNLQSQARVRMESSKARKAVGMSDNGYYWRNRDRLLAWQKNYYRNLPKTKRAQANAASNAKKKKPIPPPCALAEAWK